REHIEDTICSRFQLCSSLAHQNRKANSMNNKYEAGKKKKKKKKAKNIHKNRNNNNNNNNNNNKTNYNNNNNNNNNDTNNIKIYQGFRVSDFFGLCVSVCLERKTYFLKRRHSQIPFGSLGMWVQVSVHRRDV